MRGDGRSRRYVIIIVIVVVVAERRRLRSARERYEKKIPPSLSNAPRGLKFGPFFKTTIVPRQLWPAVVVPRSSRDSFSPSSLTTKRGKNLLGTRLLLCSGNVYAPIYYMIYHC